MIDQRPILDINQTLSMDCMRRHLLPVSHVFDRMQQRRPMNVLQPAQLRSNEHEINHMKTNEKHTFS